MISSDDFFFALRFLTDKPPSNGVELTDITSCLFGRRHPPERGRKGLTGRQEEREGEEVRGKRPEGRTLSKCLLKKKNFPRGKIVILPI